MDFEKQSYWHERFSHEESFEWLVSSSDFMAVIDPLLPKPPETARILQLGFGTSDLHTHLRRRGYEDVTNVDYEPLAVKRGTDCEERAFGDVRMKYVVADVTRLEEDGVYDLVIDKSTVDAVSCAGGEAFQLMAEGVKRSLKPGGVWISLSLSALRFSAADLPFEVEVFHRFPTPKLKPHDPDIFNFCYLLHPKPASPGELQPRRSSFMMGLGEAGAVSSGLKV
ncbi:hypothetical protein SODALDRAFT_319078 [Sodiomyces alkalinus F11]|uniref:Methyltransferase type 11 domain-containing protein n=1 Tax=Sodiomyces alkalinus (strain CBS 110278 / VKM F-3762 / F11) TaxID=1314773 RepID=A0A3N2Q6R4_SODAK|nr:hypothetical protein SODALDRAFT_319078 [Sodiomyces alkalinus F11]ROT42387.1 hypothetical protein SODALDRAFT_319078 [Sodiomyces alkalinus F11]